ncbi:hypothetical protein BK784_13735 [Bacillus thuringiensis serovar medellin]|uniref:Uncharacterized protein n=1 Tax=Bacillus thuringiensis subsp. medellin TaxID=79672 RepID=A0A9X6NB06_BACTV|nr:hypothetical protein BK784_13690 [Bacillus thuringiensis serovar medellin]OUC01014.1 hypothetical protein BK784_13735 [Bacillus thuringiensis serovar medellin]
MKRSGMGEAEPFIWRPPVLAYPGKPVRFAKRGQREGGDMSKKISCFYSKIYLFSEKYKLI